jgi:hypothetical protein
MKKTPKNQYILIAEGNGGKKFKLSFGKNCSFMSCFIARYAIKNIWTFIVWVLKHRHVRRKRKKICFYFTVENPIIKWGYFYGFSAFQRNTKK